MLCDCRREISGKGRGVANQKRPNKGTRRRERDGQSRQKREEKEATASGLPKNEEHAFAIERESPAEVDIRGHKSFSVE